MFCSSWSVEGLKWRRGGKSYVNEGEYINLKRGYDRHYDSCDYLENQNGCSGVMSS